MRRTAEPSFRAIHAVALLLGYMCALDTWAGARGGSLGVGITIVRSAAAVAQDGQVDANNQDIHGTLYVTSAYIGQTFTFGIITPPAHGTVILVDPATGSFSYTADKKFKKGVDSFTFHVMDNHGVTSNTATEYVLLRVRAKAHKAEVTTAPNTPVTGTLTVVPSYNGEMLTFTILKDPDVGVFTLTDPQTGAFSYTPPNGFTGGVFVKFRAMDETGRFSNISIERITVTPIPATAIGGSVTTRPN